MHRRLAARTVAPALAALLVLPSPALAKDLNGKLGVGFNQSLGYASSAGSVSSLSLRYGLPTGKPTVNVQIELDGGVDVSSAGTRFLGGGRFLYGVVAEDNMNLYLGAGVGYLYDGPDATSFVRVQPALEAQFFPFGLENLGFTAGIGLSVDLGSELGLTTVGGAPNVGMHYYF